MKNLTNLKEQGILLNTIKISVRLIAITLLVSIPKASYAWGDEHGRDHGRDHGDTHHGHGFRSYANSDLTLVSGMEGIDTRVLVDADPDQTPPEIDQPAPQAAAITPAQTPGADMDTFIVNVPNKKGGYTAVRIQRMGEGYVGPQGELYYPFPQISQLKAMYGI